MTDPTTTVTVRTIKTRTKTLARLRALLRYRELLLGMTRRELRVKYKGSMLGFLWSLLNPLMYLAVFSFLGIVFRMDLPYYGLYLLSGMVAWNFFQGSLMGAVGSIVANANLVNKVYFPREILPLSQVGANLVHFFLQLFILLVFMAIMQYPPAWEYALLLIPATLILVTLTAAFALTISAANVYLRDTQHLVEVTLLAWFWGTPVVYSWAYLQKSMQELNLPTGLPLMNPVTDIVLVFQRALYRQIAPVGPISGKAEQHLPAEGMEWFIRNLAIVGGGAVLLLVTAFWLFGRLEANFTEEL